MRSLRRSNNFIKGVGLLYLLLIYFTGKTQSLRPTVDFPLSKSDLIKYKISIITIEDSESPNHRMEYYLDKNGNDTALYINGRLRWMKKYETGKSGKIIKWIQYDSSRLEESRGIYTYEMDGSYTIEENYKKYKSISQSETYNNKGEIQSEFLMDGGQHIFKYDSLGRLLKIDYVPGLDGYDNYRAEYRYYNNRQLRYKKVDRVMPGLYQYSEEYFYDDRGLLTKSERTVTDSYNDEKEFYTTKYSYVFR